MTIGERIKKLRKALGLTQQEFSDRLKVSRSNIATYEVGKNNPADAVISLICREFNVSEAWLRTGDGEMFVELPQNEALAAQIQAFLQGGTDSFRERLVSLLIRLSPDQWDALEGYLLNLVGPLASALDIDAEAREMATLAYKQALSEKKQESPASSASKSAEKPA